MRVLSAKVSHTRVRCKIKQNFVFQTLQARILSGEYPAGSKLPFQAKLAQSFQVSGLTIQQAMHRLAREGFVVARRRIGTVVVSKLPHLHNLALVLPQDPLNTDFFHGSSPSFPTRRATCRINRIGRSEYFITSIATVTWKTVSSCSI